MYFQALLHGIAPIPEIAPEIRAYYEDLVDREGAPALHTKLIAIDPDYAAKIHPNDRQRIVRAFEVFKQTGQTFSAWHKATNLIHPKCQGPLIVLQVDLKILEPRLGTRIKQMLDLGAILEAKAAWQNCPDPNAPAWSGIGCMELLAYIQGRLTLEEACLLWQQNTRAYAKRQNTWFRGRKEATFFNLDASDELIDFACEAWQKVQVQNQDQNQD